MNIYFACSITGGREFEPVYQALMAALLADGHEVPTAHLAASSVVALEAIVSPAEVYQRDVEWIRKADALVAEVSAPSHGVGYEIGYALGLGKRVLCLCQADRKLSKMISGNPDPNLQLVMYRDDRDAVALAREFLQKLSRIPASSQ
ncbi:MAG TPA: nucleoside 2-deoxyribosyltransferase [Anaerolineales bacterium]|nr:nucleoside 2-deoxyribosyltransferase [Anaerolineales bacterium]